MTREEMREWGEENGSYGSCAVCGKRTWIESGCAPVCSNVCYRMAEDDGQPDRERDTLANLGLSEADFR